MHVVLTKTMRVMLYLFPLIVLLSGLSAGIHFANMMGYLPALKEVDAEHILPFWKKVDEYFSRRMPVFGMVVLAGFLASIYFMRKDTGSTYFWLVMSALVLIVVDLVITIKINTPVNEIIRTWQHGPIPENFESMRAQALTAFYGRAAVSILSFVLTMLGFISWQSKLY